MYVCIHFSPSAGAQTEPSRVHVLRMPAACWRHAGDVWRCKYSTRPSSPSCLLFLPGCGRCLHSTVQPRGWPPTQPRGSYYVRTWVLHRTPYPICTAPRALRTVCSGRWCVWGGVLGVGGAASQQDMGLSYHLRMVVVMATVYRVQVVIYPSPSWLCPPRPGVCDMKYACMYILHPGRVYIHTYVCRVSLVAM